MNFSLEAYYAELKQYGGLNVAHETALRSAMQSLLGQAGLVSDPNRPDDEEYIVRLVGKVVAVSLRTVQ